MKTIKILLSLTISIILLAGCGAGSSADNNDTEENTTVGQDNTAPVRSNASPSGTLAAGSSSAALALSTNENATCRYSTVMHQNYDAMGETFSTTGGKVHRESITGLTDGQTYRYYVRCKDAANNKNSSDLIISFAVRTSGSGATSTGFTVDHTHTALSSIPDSWITRAKSDLHIAYNHTSHGSQLVSGINALENFPKFGTKYAWSDTSKGDSRSLSLDDKGISGTPDLSQGDGDADGDGIADWAEDTYDFLSDSNNYHINVIMWSWCNISGHNIPRYLRSMEWLIAQFGENGSHERAATHPVMFIFMTAHANGGGEDDSSDAQNKLIRDHVTANDRILFDFSDIENYDPDDNYYLDKDLDDALYYDGNGDGSRESNWATEYLTAHDGEELDQLTHGDGVAGYSGVSSCAHSPEGGETADAKLNCVLKGRAVWYLFARLAGWDGQ